MTTPTMTITIDAGDSGLEASSLWQAMRATVDALDRLDRAMGQTRRPSNKWIIREISMRSPLRLTLAGERDIAAANDIDPTKVFIRGFRQIQCGKRPIYFDDAVLNDIQKIISLTHNGMGSLRYSVPEEEDVIPTSEISGDLACFRERLTKDYESLTELDGKLETINVHDQPEFFIYDRLTDNAVRCFFEPGDAEQVGQLLTRRVRVKGYAKFTANHEPKSVRVQSFKSLPDIQDVPRIRDIHQTGLSITGGQDSVEYIRGMRDAK